MILDQMIMERRKAILERSKTDMPDDFVPWAPGIVIPSDYLLRAAEHRAGSRRPEGWSLEKPDVFTKVMYGNRLMVRGCGKFWTAERELDEVLGFPFGPPAGFYPDRSSSDATC